MNDLLKRTWAEISLDHVEHNYQAMRARMPAGTRFLGVVKADAYGHGAVQVASLLSELGCEYLAVAYIDEAVELREAGITLPILILGYTMPIYTPQLLKYRLTQTVHSLDMAQEMSRIAQAQNAKLMVHLKVDTGMGRLGFGCHHGETTDRALLEIMSLPGLEAEGIYTHFSVSDTKDDEYTNWQFQSFSEILGRLEASAGVKFKIRHCTNSGAMINYEWAYLDMVRPGLSLYGMYPGGDRGQIALLPAMELRTRIVQIKEVPAGSDLSYGRTFTTKAPSRIAVISIGYSDGLHRVLSNNMDVLVRGKRASQVGRICMDMCMIDVTDIPEASVDDVVTIFGRDGEAFIPVEALAGAAGTVSYEMVCAVSKRVPRVYLRHGVML